MIDHSSTITENDHYAIYFLENAFYKTTLEKGSKPQIILDDNTVLEYIVPQATVLEKGGGEGVRMIDSVYSKKSLGECKKTVNAYSATPDIYGDGKVLRFYGKNNSLLYFFSDPEKIYQYSFVDSDLSCGLPATLAVIFPPDAPGRFGSEYGTTIRVPFTLWAKYDNKHNFLYYEEGTIKVTIGDEEKRYSIDLNEWKRMCHASDAIADDYMAYEENRLEEEREQAEEAQKQRVLEYLHSYIWYNDIVELYNSNPIQAKKKYPSGKLMRVKVRVEELREVNSSYGKYKLDAKDDDDVWVCTDNPCVIELEYPCELYIEGTFLYEAGDRYGRDLFLFGNARIVAYRECRKDVFEDLHPITVLDDSLWNL